MQRDIINIFLLLLWYMKHNIIIYTEMVEDNFSSLVIDVSNSVFSCCLIINPLPINPVSIFSFLLFIHFLSFLLLLWYMKHNIIIYTEMVEDNFSSLVIDVSNSVFSCCLIINPLPINPVSTFSFLLFIHFVRCWQGEFVYQSKVSFVGDHFLHFHPCDSRVTLTREKFDAKHSWGLKS